MNLRRTSTLYPVLLLVFPILLHNACGQGLTGSKESYTKTEYRIPMRDGIKLFTTVYAPKDTDRTYPFLLTRTPYSVRPYGPDSFQEVLGPHAGFAEEGFIFVYQDVRGRFMSEGEFVNMRPHRPNKSSPQDIDENSDTYDTIEWLLANVPNHNGRVGIYGISYPGFYTSTSIIDSHPAIRAASPQASIGDWFIGDDFHHHGAFYLLDAFSFFSVIGVERQGLTTEFPPRFDFPVSDAYRFFLEMGPLRNANTKYLKGKIAFWNDLMEHANYDEFWQARNIIPHMKNVRTPVMTVAGLFDAEDPYGPLKIYHEIEKNNPETVNTMVLGPWIHGGWSRTDGDRLGNIEFGQKSGEYYRQSIDLPFFRYYLKDEGTLDLPEALVFITGANAWRSFDSWPPETTRPLSIYLRESHGLSREKPGDDSSEGDSYLSDPDRPVPYTSQISIRRPNDYMVEDQRFAATRPDVLVYRSEVLAEDLTLVGPVTADLFFSSTGTDADIVMKLIDVFPEDAEEPGTKLLQVPMGGFQMLVRAEVMRARFRNSYTYPEPLDPGKVAGIRYDAPDIAHTFRAGHRIMVQFQSSWFPLIDRNPQKFVDIYKAEEGDFQKATHTIHRSALYPSRLEVHVLANSRE